jgi:putative FmdB family regulatory protein
MASYDLICEKCGHAFEVFRQGFLRDEDSVCPECGSKDVRQKFSGFYSQYTGTSAGGNCAPAAGTHFG